MSFLRTATHAFISMHGAIDGNDDGIDEDDESADEEVEAAACGDGAIGASAQLVPSCRMASCSMRTRLRADTFCASAASVMARRASI